MLTGAHVTRVLLDGKRARGVEYLRRGKTETAECAREVILSGGAINSPQILMLSGVGPADGLSAHGIGVVHELPGVGRNLEDHTAVALMWAMREPRSLMAAQRPGELLKFLFQRKGMLTSNVAEVCAFVRTEPGIGAPDVQFHFAPVFFDTNLEAEPKEHAITVGPVLVAPASKGTIELASRDPLAAPRIDPGFLSDPEARDLTRLVAAVKLARTIVAQPALASLRGAELQPGDAMRTDDELAEFVRRKCSTLYHPTGTCRMGVGRDAVVDPELRVHGIVGLRVADASIFPRIPRGNTNAPAILVGEKAAAMMRAAH